VKLTLPKGASLKDEAASLQLESRRKRTAARSISTKAKKSTHPPSRRSCRQAVALNSSGQVETFEESEVLRDSAPEQVRDRVEEVSFPLKLRRYLPRLARLEGMVAGTQMQSGLIASRLRSTRQPCGQPSDRLPTWWSRCEHADHGWIGRLWNRRTPTAGSFSIPLRRSFSERRPYERAGYGSRAAVRS